MGQFIKQTIASVLGTLIGITLMVLLGAIGLTALVTSVALKEEASIVKEPSVLVLDLSTPIQDTLPPPDLSKALSGEELKTFSLRQILETLDKAADDPKIVGLLLDGRKGASISGYPALNEVREALQGFQQTGKPIFAYGVDWGERGYFLASIADTLAIHPIGSMTINGFNAEQLFWAEAFEKYGIGVQIVRVGDYKSAVEPFTRQDFSPESREQTQALLGDLWGNFIQAIAASRGLKPSQLQTVADEQGIVQPQGARSQGLVDEVVYFDELETQLKQLTGQDDSEHRFRKITLADYTVITPKGHKTRSSAQKIALVYAEGNIITGTSRSTLLGSDSLVKELRKVRRDDDVKAMVLRINSPGGSAVASDVILREVQLIQAEKPVMVSMGNVAASGGYWIALGGDRIFAEPTTITGSIGVFSVLLNLEVVAQNNGLSWDAVKTAALADVTTATRPKTSQELAIYQQQVNRIYQLFIDKVAQARDLPKEQVNVLAQGRVWSGEDAKDLGLVDQIGGLEMAIISAAEQAELGNDWEVVEYPKQRSLEERLLARFQDEEGRSSVADPLTLKFLKFKEELTLLQTFNAPSSIYARLPFNLQID